MMKVAIVHYWLIGMRGGEKVLEALLDLYPEAIIITHVYDKSKVSEKIRKHEVRETFIGKLPYAIKLYQKYLPLMPLALESMDLQEFDLIISSESGPAKGVIPRPDATHICYCHSPMRYIWDHYHIYKSRSGFLSRLVMPILAHRLRIWDVSSASRVDQFVANSSFIRDRIQKYYRREACVVYPPVATDDFSISDNVGDKYLLAGELVSYKRADLAIDAFNKSGRELVVIGDGEMRDALEKKAGPNITFLGKVPFDELKTYFANCRALIFPGEEDFGIIPVEVMASGRPVIAFGRGGVLDTVKEGLSGIIFHQQSVESLNDAVLQFESNKSLGAPEEIKNWAKKFDTEVFKEKMQKQIERAQSCRALKVDACDVTP